MHSAESTKLRATEIFRCFLCLNKFSFLLHFYLVQNLDIILWNVSSCFNIFLKFLDSWLAFKRFGTAHALEVTIFQGLLLRSRAKTGIQNSGMKVKTINFQLLKGISFSTLTSWDIHFWIMVMFVGADQFLEIFLDLHFLSCILTRYWPMCTTNLTT